MSFYKNLYNALSFILIIGIFATAPSKAQQLNEGEVIDKIIAIVGNEPIMLSELNSQLMIFQQQDPKLNINDPATKQKVLDAIINEKLVITKANEDSLTATDEEIKQQWEYQLNEFVKYYGSIKRIEDIYSMSIDRIQYEFRDEIKKHIISQKIKQLKFGEIKANQREVEEFFVLYKDSLPVVPAQIELYHIVKNIEPQIKEKKHIFDLAVRVRDSLMKGADFADFAKRYSADPGTVNSGGELGWFEKGKLFPEFEKAAQDLEINQISMPVETPFGYHIIQTLNKNKDSLFTKHILFKFGQTDDDKTAVVSFLKDIKQRAETGTPFENLAKDLSDETETRGFGGLIGKFPLSNIPPALKETVDAMKEGEISDPLPYASVPKVSYHVIYKKQIIPEHKATIKDDYKQLEQLATQYKQAKLYQDWMEQLRKTMYWEVKEKL